jgi:DNA-binding MarR family transcriptional regulator
MNYPIHSDPDAAGHSGEETADHADSDAMLTLIMAARAVEDRVEDALSELGLSMSKLTVLTKLVEAGEPLTLGEIAARLNCVRSNVTQLIDRLEVDGLVRRIDHASDRRSIRAELTVEGRVRQERGAELLGQVRSTFSARLGAENSEALVKLLTRLG